jgi:hypothetical protein
MQLPEQPAIGSNHGALRRKDDYGSSCRLHGPLNVLEGSTTEF